MCPLLYTNTTVYGVVEADEVFLTPTKKLYELIKDFKIRQQICK